MLHASVNIAMALAFVANPAVQNPQGDGTHRELLDEIKALRAQMETLSLRMKNLESELLVTRQMLDDAIWGPESEAFGDFRLGGPRRSVLESIQLPSGATPQQVREYVASIVRASAGQSSWSDEDPQVEMLMQVGPSNLAILLDFLSGGMAAFHVRTAITKLASDQHKELILAKLPVHPELVTAIVRNGWEADAMPILIEGLERTPNCLPREWIEAVARDDDAATREALVAYFVEGGNRAHTFEVLRRMEGLSLEEPVALAWDRAKFGPSWERNSTAAIAVGYGAIDALEQIATEVVSGTAEEHTLPKLLRAIADHVDAKGSAKEAAEWVLANKEYLYWDAHSKKYRRR